MNSKNQNLNTSRESYEDRAIFRLTVTGDVENHHWKNSFEDILKQNTESTQFRFLVDNRFGNDKIDIEGFKMLGNLFRQYEVQDCKVGILTTDKGMDILKDLFLDVLKNMGFDFQSKIFFNEQDTVEWLVQ